MPTTIPQEAPSTSAAAPSSPVQATASRIPAPLIVSTTRLLPPPSAGSPTPALLAAPATPSAVPAAER